MALWHARPITSSPILAWPRRLSLSLDHTPQVRQVAARLDEQGQLLARIAAKLGVDEATAADGGGGGGGGGGDAGSEDPYFGAETAPDAPASVFNQNSDGPGIGPVITHESDDEAGGSRFCA
jgi:hypothetical protein